MEGPPRSPDGRVQRRVGTRRAAGHWRASSPAQQEGQKSRRGLGARLRDGGEVPAGARATLARPLLPRGARLRWSVG